MVFHYIKSKIINVISTALWIIYSSRAKLLTLLTNFTEFYLFISNIRNHSVGNNCHSMEIHNIPTAEDQDLALEEPWKQKPAWEPQRVSAEKFIINY